MWKTSFASLRLHKRRLFGTALAVVMGVAFLSATLILGATTREGVKEIFTEANAGTDVVVRSEQRFETESGDQQGLLAASLVDTVRAVDGVAAAEPEVAGFGQIVAADGDPIGGEGPPTLASNWIADPALNAYDIAEGRGPEVEGEVVIDRGSARRGDLAVGDTTTVLVPDPVPVTIVGVVTMGDDDDALGRTTFVGFTLEQAQTLLAGGAGRITSVLVAGDGRPAEDVESAVRAVAPAGVEVMTGAELTAEQRQSIEDDFLSFTERFFMVFAGIALLTASFGIYNTFSILVAQRSRESALLRAVGASKAQVLWATMLEALLVGAVASAVGVAGGIGLSAGVRALLESADFGLPSSGVDVATGRLVVAGIVGVVVTVVASLAPAVKAARVAPVAALREVAVDRSAGSRVRFLLGTVLAAGGVLLTISATRGEGDIGVAGLGAITTLAGLVALGPVVARPASWAIGLPLAGGLSGRLARRNAMRSPRRTSGAASSLLVGVGVVTLFTGFAASMKASMEDAVDRAFRGDLVVESSGFSGANLSPALVDAVARLPEVEVSLGLAEGEARIDGEQRDVLVAEPARFLHMLDLDLQEGAWDDADASLAISRKIAEDESWSVGDVVDVGFVDGTVQPMPVGAVYEDRTIAGDILLPQSVWVQHVAQRTEIVVLVDVRDGADLAAARASIEGLAQRYGDPPVRDRDEFLDAQAAEIDQMLGLVYGLLFMAVLIAVMGIANTVSLSIHERTRELGLLRAVGQQRRQLRSMVRREAMIVSLFGTLGGIGIGVFLAWALVRVVAAHEGLGTFAVPYGQLGVILGLGAVAGVIAAARPARRAARMPVLDAVATS
jgi:putative ABC transport system permease protein